MKLLQNNLKQLSHSGFLTKSEYNFNVEFTLLKNQLVLTRKSLRKHKQTSYIYTRNYNRKKQTNIKFNNIVNNDNNKIIWSDDDLTMDDDSSEEELPSEINALHNAIEKNKNKCLVF
jgi:hypothetical protein